MPLNKYKLEYHHVHTGIWETLGLGIVRVERQERCVHVFMFGCMHSASLPFLRELSGKKVHQILA